MAVSKALQILGYFELPDDEQPDESIWNNPSKLEEWWEEIKNRRNNPSDRNRSEQQEWENVDLEQNEIAKEWRKANT